MRIQHVNGRAGFSLVEIAIATGVLTLFLAGVFGCLSMAQRGQIMARERQLAMEAAQARVNSIASLPFDDIDDTDGSTFSIVYRFDDADADGEVDAGETVALPSGDSAADAGRVQVVSDLDGDGAADDLDDDGVADRVEIRAIVLWRSVDGSVQQIEANVRRARRYPDEKVDP